MIGKADSVDPRIQCILDRAKESPCRGEFMLMPEDSVELNKIVGRESMPASVFWARGNVYYATRYGEHP